ncbi:MAG: hypothetical protein V1921_02565 [Candidatus Altiarchaeota archaeon]
MTTKIVKLNLEGGGSDKLPLLREPFLMEALSTIAEAKGILEGDDTQKMDSACKKLDKYVIDGPDEIAQPAYKLLVDTLRKYNAGKEAKSYVGFALSRIVFKTPAQRSKWADLAIKDLSEMIRDDNIIETDHDTYKYAGKALASVIQTDDTPKERAVKALGGFTRGLGLASDEFGTMVKRLTLGAEYRKLLDSPEGNDADPKLKHVNREVYKALDKNGVEILPSATISKRDENLWDIVTKEKHPMGAFAKKIHYVARAAGNSVEFFRKTDFDRSITNEQYSWMYTHMLKNITGVAATRPQLLTEDFMENLAGAIVSDLLSASTRSDMVTLFNGIVDRRPDIITEKVIRKFEDRLAGRTPYHLANKPADDEEFYDKNSKESARRCLRHIVRKDNPGGQVRSELGDYALELLEMYPGEK